jgi:hypothetical protein
MVNRQRGSGLNRAHALVFALLAAAVPPAAAQTPGLQLPTQAGKTETTASIMERQAAKTVPYKKLRRGLQEPDRSQLPQNPAALEASRFPQDAPLKAAPGALAIHTTGLSFDGATLTDTGAFPPDSMGAVGPTQFVTFVNGRIRSFTKAGVADGVINADPDTFFASVTTPVAGSVVLDFTSDPNVRYDRFTGRWILTIIDVPCTNATCTTTAANRVMLAVSDAASAGTITGSTVWTFFYFTASAGSDFCDYPSLGVDVNALYIGCDMFTSAGVYNGTNGYVVRKSTTLGAGPITVTSFANLATSSGSGPFAPRGVDNHDSTATEGYFIGTDNATFSTLMFRRVSNPGSATPTISANISLTVPTTTSSNPVTHAGNTGGNNGRLDALDDRLYQAMVRNGRLWTAHNFRVSSAGVANTATTARNASRWYEFQNLTTTPTLVQSGTVFDNAATLAAARQYWIPSVTVTGQGHAVLGFSMAGTPIGATPAFVGRLSGDTLGTMVGPPTTAAVTFGTTTANYNPSSDPGGSSGRRWGDYSFTSVDPLDDMTVWTIQEYNQALNSYAVRVGKLAAPAPAMPASASTSVCQGASNVDVVITGTSSGGTGFYDPGANLPAPALAFQHITAAISGAGITINSVTYTDPTHVTLNVSVAASAAAGAHDVTVTNPDGQAATGTGIFTVSLAPTTATVGSGQSTCAGGTTASLGGNTPSVGTGAWSVVSGGTGTFSNASSGTSTFTHTGGTGPVVLRWTISNPPCAASTADVSITVTQPPTAATVGGSQTICASGTTTSLGGNTPSVGTGSWSIVSGGTGTFSAPTSGTSTFTHTGGTGPVVLRWTISNPPCAASTADVSITVTQAPSTAAVGGNQTICASGTTASLGGNTPSVGTGAWSVVSGGTGTFSNASSGTSTFTHTGGTGPVVLRWTISNPPCAASTADVSITVTQPPTVATVGGSQEICAGGTTASLGGNDPSVGTGSWSVVSGGTGTFSNASSGTSTFTHTGGAGPVVLRWTISNPPCASSTADVSVTVKAVPATPTIIVPMSVIPTGVFQASVTAVAGVTYAWQVTNGTVTAGAGTNQVTIKAGTSGSVSISVTETLEATGCDSAPGTTAVTIELPPGAAVFYDLTQCRVFDTRSVNPAPEAASPVLAAGETRLLSTTGRCSIPASAKALSANITAVGGAATGEILVFPGNESATSSTMVSFRLTIAKAGAAIVKLAPDGSVNVLNRSTGTVEFILDVNGYFE